MSLTLQKLLTLHDLAYEHGYSTRLKAADDMLFAWVTQWDDTYLSQSDLGYRGEFNIIRKAVRQILTDLTINAISVDFEPIDGTGDDAADIIDGMYRADMRNNTALEGTKNARQEAVVCGVGAWELRNEYKNSFGNDDKQVIRRYPLFEANNNIMWDPNAKLIDKSDAKYVSCLIPYSPEGYEDLCEELGVDDPNKGDASFAFPEISYVFPWISESKKVYVTRFYYRERKKVKYQTFEDMFGAERTIKADEFKDFEDEFLENGFDLVSEKEIERYVITCYIASGGRILDESIVPGEEIPVIPMYGERQFVEGEETYEGIVRLAKDPQRLRNFQMSYLADIVSRSPREKPIFTSQQINGFEDMYEESGPENNYPYLLQNGTDGLGKDLPIGPVGYLKNPEVPPALMISMQESRMAVDDVAGAGLPADITDVDLSGKALSALNKRMDMQSYTYQDNSKFAMRREGEIYASMARDVYDTNQTVILVKEDGTKVDETINQESMNFDTMQREIKNDMQSMIFDVYANIGPSFESVKEQNREELKELLTSGTLEPEVHTMLMNEYLTMIDGSGFKDIRKFARNKLIMMGVKPPETDEEKQMLAQSQQEQQPSFEEQAEMTRAQADLTAAQGKVMEEENKRMARQTDLGKAQADAQNKTDKLMSETELNIAKVTQEQQKIDNKRIDDNDKNAIALTQIETNAGLELNKQLNENKRELERTDNASV